MYISNGVRLGGFLSGGRGSEMASTPYRKTCVLSRQIRKPSAAYYLPSTRFGKRSVGMARLWWLASQILDLSFHSSKIRARKQEGRRWYRWDCTNHPASGKNEKDINIVTAAVEK